MPPIFRVFGMRQNDATHHSGKMINPKKNIHACMGEPDPGSPGVARRSDHGVSNGLGGLFGSRIWNVVEYCDIEGAWGEMRALIGIEVWDISDILRRGPWRCG